MQYCTKGIGSMLIVMLMMMKWNILQPENVDNEGTGPHMLSVDHSMQKCSVCWAVHSQLLQLY